MDTLGNVNHAINISGYWVFESNYEQELFLTRESLDILFSPSEGEEQVVNFETFVYAVGYMWSPSKLKIG